MTRPLLLTDDFQKALNKALALAAVRYASGPNPRYGMSPESMGIIYLSRYAHARKVAREILDNPKGEFPKWPPAEDVDRNMLPADWFGCRQYTEEQQEEAKRALAVVDKVRWWIPSEVWCRYVKES